MSAVANVCPQCGATFRGGVVQCTDCKLELVDADTARVARERLLSPRKALEGKQVVALLHGNLPSCREIERLLLGAGVPCLVEATAEEGEALAPGALKVGVMVAEEDLARAAEVLRTRFQTAVEREGLGAILAEAIDLTASEVACPACGHTGALVDGACGDCGLFLGVPES